MICKLEDGKKAMSVFGDWPETMIWSCMQGVMGELYTDDLENPRSVMAILGDFCFFAGTPEQEILAFRPEWCRQDFMILVPQDERWAETIEDYLMEVSLG